jgi:hypothetical protein
MVMHVHKHPNRKRRTVSLTLNPEVVREAKQLGANLSRVCEDALKSFISRNNPENRPIGDCLAPYDNPMCAKTVAPGKGFEPLRPRGPHALKACALPGFATPAPNIPRFKVITTFPLSQSTARFLFVRETRF